MPKWKTWQKNLARFLVFCLLAGLMIVYVDRVLWDKSGTILSFYEEPRNTIDVLYLGGSHSNAAVSPTQIYEQQGFTGHVLYSWSQPIWTSYHYLLEGLKTQKPKVVVLDSFGLVYGHTYISDVDINNVSNQWSLLIPPSLNRIQLAMAMSRCQMDHRPFYRYASLLEHHNRWKVVTKEDLLWPLRDYYSTAKGYGPLYTTEGFDPVYMSADAASNGLMEPVCMEYLQKFVELSKKEGFQLVLLSLPYVASPEEFGIYQQAYDYCRENNVPVVDYFNQATADEAGFDWNTDMAEHAHVNYLGAEKISAHLGSWLAQNFDLPDHRADPDYAAWAQAVKAESKSKQDMEVKLTSELTQLLSRAMNPDYATLVLTRGNLAASDAAQMVQAFEKYGLDAAPFEECGRYSLAVMQNGQIQTQQTGQNHETLRKTMQGANWTLTAENDGKMASVRLNDQEVLLDHEGVSVVVVDAASGSLVQSISFVADQGYAPYTD